MSNDEEEREDLVANMMLLAAYVQRLDYTDGDFTKTAEKNESLTRELLAVHSRLSADEKAPPGEYRLPNVADIITGDLAAVKKELCQVVGEFDKAINAGRKAKG